MNEKILEAKKAVVDEVNQTLVGSKCAVVISYQGLKVSELNVLRKGLKSVGATMQMVSTLLIPYSKDQTLLSQPPIQPPLYQFLTNLLRRTKH